MNPNNPLLVYRNWFLKLELDPADLLALEIFKKLSPFHPAGSDFRTIFEGEKENILYSGLEASKLIDLIDALVQTNEKFTNQRTAVILLSATTFLCKPLKPTYHRIRRKKGKNCLKA